MIPLIIGFRYLLIDSVDRKIGQVNSELDLLRLPSSYNVTSLYLLTECDGDPRSKYVPNTQYSSAKCQDWGPSFDYFRRKQQVTIIFVAGWEKFGPNVKAGTRAVTSEHWADHRYPAPVGRQTPASRQLAVVCILVSHRYHKVTKSRGMFFCVNVSSCLFCVILDIFIAWTFLLPFLFVISLG